MDSELCGRYVDEAAAFVLGDLPAERRPGMVAHLDRCPACRHEVTTLTVTLDSITAATRPVPPTPGFVERVLAAGHAAGLTAGALDEATATIVDMTRRRGPRPIRGASRAGSPERTAGMTLTTATPDDGALCRLPPPIGAQTRPVAVVARRRRTLAALTGAAVLLGVLGLSFGWALLGPAVAVAALDVIYLSLVITVAHTKVREGLVGRHRARRVPDDGYWRELRLEMLPGSADEPADPPVVAVRNTALIRFVLSYFLGWALTPLVAVIRLRRGGLAGVEQSPLLGAIVALQRRGRAQSLRLLVAGATTVAVAGGGATTVLIAPRLAAAAPAATYTVRPGDTLWGIADQFGVSTASLAQLNGIADPNVIVVGETIRLGGAPAASGGAPSGGGRYTVQAGDTLDAIAERFGTTGTVLAALNHIADPDLILVGQVLQVPAGAGSAGPTTAEATPTPARTYTVQAGDTLGAIAERFGISPAALAERNHLVDPNLIYEGQVLSLSGAATAPAPSAPAPSAPSSAAPPSTPATTVSTPAPSHYVNPFASGSWSPSRIDEGVDWIPNTVSPVVAIGDGVITYSSTSSGWPAGGFIAYRLTNGSHAGQYIYVAEHITDLLPVGSVVSAGQRIATALPGYPWTEWGWGSAVPQEPAPSAQYNGLADGTATPGGKAFARFLLSLGVSGVPDPGPGPTTP